MRFLPSNLSSCTGYVQSSITSSYTRYLLYVFCLLFLGLSSQMVCPPISTRYSLYYTRNVLHSFFLPVLAINCLELFPFVLGISSLVLCPSILGIPWPALFPFVLGLSFQLLFPPLLGISCPVYCCPLIGISCPVFCPPMLGISCLVLCPPVLCTLYIDKNALLWFFVFHLLFLCSTWLPDHKTFWVLIVEPL